MNLLLSYNTCTIFFHLGKKGLIKALKTKEKYESLQEDP